MSRGSMLQSMGEYGVQYGEYGGAPCENPEGYGLGLEGPGHGIRNIKTHEL